MYLRRQWIVVVPVQIHIKVENVDDAEDCIASTAHENDKGNQSGGIKNSKQEKR